MAKSRKSHARKIVVGGCALAIIAVLCVIGYYVVDIFKSFDKDFLRGGEAASVPQVVGMTREDAEAALRNAGFVPAESDNVIREDVPAGIVFRQDPEAGRSKKLGSKIRYFVSLGNPRFVIPDLLGKDFGDAVRLIEEAGMQLGHIDRMYTPNSSGQKVLSQDPPAGKEFPDSVSVDLWVADNTALPEVSMPNLGGMQLRAAEELLVRNNLQLNRVDYVSNDSVASGSVVTQNVQAGESLKLGAKISLSVAVPRELITSWTRTISVRVPVTGGPRQQQVKIKVFDQIAQNTIVYDEMHTSGSFVDKQIPLEGRATVMIYIQDMEHAYREEHIPYENPEE